MGCGVQFSRPTRELNMPVVILSIRRMLGVTHYETGPLDIALSRGHSACNIEKKGTGPE